MNIKRIFGSLLTALGIGGLIYTAVVFTNTRGSNQDIRSLIIYGILGIVFFIAGIGLHASTRTPHLPRGGIRPCAIRMGHICIKGDYAAAPITGHQQGAAIGAADGKLAATDTTKNGHGGGGASETQSPIFSGVIPDDIVAERHVDTIGDG